MNDEALLHSYIDEIILLEIEIELKKESLRQLKKDCVRTLGIKSKELSDQIKEYRPRYSEDC